MEAGSRTAHARGRYLSRGHGEKAGLGLGAVEMQGCVGHEFEDMVESRFLVSF